MQPAQRIAEGIVYRDAEGREWQAYDEYRCVVDERDRYLKALRKIASDFAEHPTLTDYEVVRQIAREALERA